MTRTILLLIITLFIISTISGQEYSKKELRYKPINLNEAVEQLKKIHHDSTKQEIMTMTEEEFLGESHFGLGMWIRNNWGLWKGKELAKYFNSIGIYHPDDMSGIISTSYYRELHEQDWEVNEQIKYYQDYWKKSNEHYQRLETDTAYQKMIQVQQDSIQETQLDLKKSEWIKGKKVSGYVEHRCGILEGFFLRTQIEGTILEWQENKLLIHIDNYVDEKKKKRVIKCYNVNKDIILIEQHGLFRLKEE